MDQTSDVPIPEFRDKLLKLFAYSKAFSHSSFTKNKITALSTYLGLSRNYLSSRFEKATLPSAVERAILITYGIGPSDCDLPSGSDTSWLPLSEHWRSWRQGTAREFNAALDKLKPQARRDNHPVVLEALASIKSDVSLYKGFSVKPIFFVDEDYDQLTKAFHYSLTSSVKPRATGAHAIGHLSQVVGLVIESGGSLQEATAALLHDLLEDYPNQEQRITELFGAEVFSIVQECSDRVFCANETKKRWLNRKSDFLGGMHLKSNSALRIITADKLHNSRAMYREARSEGDRLWDELGRAPEETVAYFKVAHEILSRLFPTDMTVELGLVAALLESSFCKDLKLYSDTAMRFRDAVTRQI